MSDTLIKVENLSKVYTIRNQTGERYTALRDVLSTGVKGLLRSATSHQPPATSQEFWALKDVSFEVKQGERVGIIGHNGAGKSTLLKILSRITEPTKGRIHIKGRVASLLEVGTGFHPELTGRENIYLNGAILGMRKTETDHKFDEIADFSGVEKFIDTPVKRYSSGMYMRLAFAVAAHLEPDILLIDEVLAVGDAEFQKRCVGKMEEVSNQGRTVLFVSHNMAMISSLCSTGILLKDGLIFLNSRIEDAIKEYLRSVSSTSHDSLYERNDRRGNGRVKFTYLNLVVDGEEGLVPYSGCNLNLVLGFSASDNSSTKNVSFAVIILDMYGKTLFTCFTNHLDKTVNTIPLVGEITCNIPTLPLSSGTYKINAWCSVMSEEADFIENAADLTVQKGDFFGTGKLPEHKHGPFLVNHDWILIN